MAEQNQIGALAGLDPAAIASAGVSPQQRTAAAITNGIETVGEVNQGGGVYLRGGQPIALSTEDMDVSYMSYDAQ